MFEQPGDISFIVIYDPGDGGQVEGVRQVLFDVEFYFLDQKVVFVVFLEFCISNRCREIVSR